MKPHLLEYFSGEVLPEDEIDWLVLQVPYDDDPQKLVSMS